VGHFHQLGRGQGLEVFDNGFQHTHDGKQFTSRKRLRQDWEYLGSKRRLLIDRWCLWR
jgi:hypothetical protein